MLNPYEGLEPPAGGDKILVLGQEIAARRAANQDAQIADGVVGRYITPNGTEFVFPEVKYAWDQTRFGTPDYLPASGEKDFIRGTEDLVFGDDADQIRANGIATLGTVGGTGALNMWAQFHRKISKGTPSPILVSDPTWPNHPQIFKDQGILVREYKHLTRDNKYDVEAHADAIRRAPEGSVVLFHSGRTHNPTGANPRTPEEIQFLAEAMDGKQALIDMAYLGFGGEIETEREPIPTFLKMGIPLSVCVSYSKIMALYKERAGALLMPTSTMEEARIVQEHLSRACARVTWSNPPAQGERVAGQVLTKPEVLDSWKETLRFVAKTIADHRKALAQALGPDFAQIAEQAGLFSLLPLSDAAVTELKEKDGIYLLPGGVKTPGLARLSVMGIPENQIPRFAEAVQRVMNM